MSSWKGEPSRWTPNTSTMLAEAQVLRALQDSGSAFCMCLHSGRHQQHMSEMFSKDVVESCACLRRVLFRGRRKFLCR